jgi:hypothetical protein
MKKQLLSLGILAAVLAPAAAFGQTVDFGTQYGANIGLGTQDVRTTIANIIRVALGILGIVVTLIIIAGGFRWMTAGGNEEAVATAKKMISSAIIGLLIIIIAYAITNWVFSVILGATNQ